MYSRKKVETQCNLLVLCEHEHCRHVIPLENQNGNYDVIPFELTIDLNLNYLIVNRMRKRRISENNDEYAQVNPYYQGLKGEQVVFVEKQIGDVIFEWAYEAFFRKRGFHEKQFWMKPPKSIRTELATCAFVML